MPILDLPQTSLYSLQTATRGTLDTANLWATIGARGEWLVNRLVRSCAWGDGPDGKSFASGSVTTQRRYDLGTWLLAHPGGEPSNPTIHLYVDAFTTGNCVWKSQFYTPGGEAGPTAIGDAQTIATPSGTGWVSATLTYPWEVEGDVLLNVYAECSAATNQRITAASLIWEQGTTTRASGTSPTTWPKVDLAHAGGDDRPDDVYTLERMRDQQNFLAMRVPHTLAAHNWIVPTVACTDDPATDASKVIARYKIRRGADVNTLRVYAYVQQTRTAGLDGVVELFVDGVSVDSVALSGTSAAWYTLDAVAADFATADTTYEITVKANAGYSESDTATLYSVVAWELDSARTANDWKISGDTMPGQYVSDGFQQPAPGDAIVGSNAAGDYAYRRNDRVTQAENNAFLGYRSTQLLICDVLNRDITTASTDPHYYRNGTQASYDSPTTLATIKYTAGYLARLVEVWGRVRRTSYREPDLSAKVALYKDADTSPSATLTLRPNTPGERIAQQGYSFLGSVAVSGGTDVTLTVKGGFVDAGGGGESPLDDALLLEGLTIREVPDLEL